MSAGAVHAIHSDVVSTGDSYTVILIVDGIIVDQCVVGRTHIEAVGIVSGGKASAESIWGIPGPVIQEQVLQRNIGAARDAEQMSGPIPNMQVVDHGSCRQLVYDNKMVRPRTLA